MTKNNFNLIHINIKTIKFPITAIASILHRISGFFLFLIIGPILWLIKLSLSSESNFHKIHNFLLVNNQFFKLLIFGLVILFNYHFIFGIRQILMDLGFLKSTLIMGKLSAVVVFMLVICLSIYVGIYI